MVDQTIKKYNRLDVLVYNSGAIWWASVENTPMKRFQLMQRINPEGLYGAIQASLPHFYKNGSDGKGKGRIVVISPPIYSRFLKGKTAYAMGKVCRANPWSSTHVNTVYQFGMSALTMGLVSTTEYERHCETVAVTITGFLRHVLIYIRGWNRLSTSNERIDQRCLSPAFGPQQYVDIPKWKFQIR